MTRPTKPEPCAHYDELAEAAVIGAVLSDRTAWDVLQGHVEATDFYSQTNARLWRCCARLSAQGKPLKFVALNTELKATGELERIGGYQALRTIVQAATPAPDALVYAKTVRTCAAIRTVRDAAKAVWESCDNPAVVGDVERETLANTAHAQLNEAVGILNRTKPKGGALGRTTLLASVRAAFDALEAFNAGAPPVRSSIPFGFEAIDAKAEMPIADLTALGGNPESGKSALLKGFLTRWADAGRRPGLILVEDRLAHFRNRVLAEWLQLEVKLVRRALEGDPAVDAAIRQRIAEGLIRWLGGSTRGLPDWDCYEGAAMTVEQVAMEARRMVAAGCGIIAVDTFSRIKLPRWPSASKMDRVNHNVDTLAELGPELGVPVIVTVHLSREHRKEKRAPNMSDFRDTGHWEQHARLMLIANKGAVIIAKANHGATGVVQVGFDGPTTTWGDAAAAPQPTNGHPAWSDEVPIDPL